MLKGVILAAGHGARLGPFGKQNPKPIIPIANKPLIYYQIEILKSLGIQDIIIVVGHLGFRIIQTVGIGKEFGVNIHYVEQEKRLGLAHAVGQLETLIQEPFLLILGDIFFYGPNLISMVDTFINEKCDCVIATKIEDDMENIKRNFSVLTDENNNVIQLIEKPKFPKTNIKGCGIYLFKETIFEGIHRTPRTALRDEYELTDSIQIMVDLGYRVKALPVVEWDVNITFIKDLISCCLFELKRQGKNLIQGENSHIGENCKLVNTVIGNNVIIGNYSELIECVILDNVNIPPGTKLSHRVVSEEGVLD
ncbi:MAG: sugar phosphate nucleotidyltransferase [Candidatus Hydrogenedentes bacterium]|nr:sugar phosphate nucleotidyltransferase [Candidatus Hydrogenedentota bacterium]